MRSACRSATKATASGAHPDERLAEDVDFALAADFSSASAFVQVFDTGIADGLVRDTPFVLKPGGAFRLPARTLVLFQHATEPDA